MARDLSRVNAGAFSDRAQGLLRVFRKLAVGSYVSCSSAGRSRRGVYHDCDLFRGRPLLVQPTHIRGSWAKLGGPYQEAKGHSPIRVRVTKVPHADLIDRGLESGN